VKVLIACEFSGRMREAYRLLGHDAWSCDLLPAEDASPYHIQGDVRPLLRERWDQVVAHPSCTRLCNSGVRWLAERDLWGEMREACAFFLECLGANADQVAVENPVMHGHAQALIGRGPDFTVQPWMFGDNFKKRTGWWVKGLPRLVPTSDLDGSTAAAEVHRASPGPDRWKLRSRTYPGMAAACAMQWGGWA